MPGTILSGKKNGKGTEKQRRNEVLLVIPAYNEAESIERVVDEIIESYPGLDYVVVTDGSTDGTDVICAERGYNTVRLPENLGLTGCFHNGMVYAYEHGYRYAVQFDGDGQHRPEYIDAMYKKALEGFDIVMGSRFLGTGLKKTREMGLFRALGSVLISAAIRLKTGVVITDPTCGLRLYSGRIIRLFAQKDYFAPEPDTMVLLIKKGAKTAEVPVKVAERTAGASYLSAFRAAKYMFRILSSILNAG